MKYNFTYDESNVPFLSGEQINNLAKEFLNEFDPIALGYKRLRTMEHLLEYIAERDNIDLAFEDLSSLGEEVLGFTDFKNKRILIDVQLASNPKLESIFNFVCGHEIGHWELHRHRNFQLFDTDQGEIKKYYSFVCSRQWFKIEMSNKLSPRRFLEWQANKFSSFLLYPEVQLKDLIIKWQKEKGMRNIGTIYLDGQPVNTRNFIELCSYLNNDYFRGSKQALRIRLKELGILKENEIQVNRILGNTTYFFE